MRRTYWIHPKAPNRQMHRVPRWLRFAILRAIREGRLPSPEDANGTGDRLLRHLWEVTPFHRYFDHWGTETTPTGERILVSEPYRPSDVATLMADVESLASLLRCRGEVSADSQWNPPATIRIELRP